MRTVSIGDSIEYKSYFGAGSNCYATVRGMELTEHPRAKYGKSIDTAQHQDIIDNRVVFTLSDNHWIYSEQLVFGGVA